MSWVETVLLLSLVFVVTAIGVVTGSNSLISVPVMFELGIDPRVAIATNMFGLTFMALGAVVPFYREGLVDVKKLTPLTVLTVVGSALGSLLVGIISVELIPRIVSGSMIAVAIFMIAKPSLGSETDSRDDYKIGATMLVVGALLAVYGGFYSGGYMTVLTALLVLISGMSFRRAIAGTKFLNLFSSLIATLVFIWQGLVDFRLGFFLAVTMFVAAFVGAKTVTRMNEKWLKGIFLAVVILIAIKILVFG